MMAKVAGFPDTVPLESTLNLQDDRPLSSPISLLSKECAVLYQNVLEALQKLKPEQATENGFDQDSILLTTQDARSRFKAWGNSIAAFQDARLKSSLDARLQEANDVRSRVLKVLENLKESLDDAFLIVTGVAPNETWGALSDSEEEVDVRDNQKEPGPETTELDQLYVAIQTANASLMKLSIVIRNSPSRDDYLKAAARYRYDSRFDIGHVREKHPAGQKSEWLIERLGKAITRRRAFLKYRQEHHEKLSKDWDDVVEEQDDKRPETIAMSKHTKATTFVVDIKAAAEKGGSEPGSFGSQTSYEQTVIGEGAETRLTVPPPPKEAFEGVPFAYGEPFQCPLCFTEQTVKNKAAWKKHVFRDLKPYVCTFDCNLKMFKSRNEWFTHELQFHRREYTCHLCQTVFAQKNSIANHLKLKHHIGLAGSELEALLLQSEEPVDRIPASACLICDEWKTTLEDPKQDARRLFLNNGKEVEPYGTLNGFRRHLGRHMEQLALFALPKGDDDQPDDDSVDSEDSDGEFSPVITHCEEIGCKKANDTGGLFCSDHCCTVPNCGYRRARDDRRANGAQCIRHLEESSKQESLAEEGFMPSTTPIIVPKQAEDTTEVDIRKLTSRSPNMCAHAGCKTLVFPIQVYCAQHIIEPLGDTDLFDSSQGDAKMSLDVTEKSRDSTIPSSAETVQTQTELDTSENKEFVWLSDPNSALHCFPLSSCKTWNEMARQIEGVYKGRHTEAEATAILNGEYDVYTSNGMYLQKQEWENFVEAGVRVTLHWRHSVHRDMTDTPLDLQTDNQVISDIEGSDSELGMERDEVEGNTSDSQSAIENDTNTNSWKKMGAKLGWKKSRLGHGPGFSPTSSSPQLQNTATQEGKESEIAAGTYTFAAQDSKEKSETLLSEVTGLPKVTNVDEEEEKLVAKRKEAIEKHKAEEAERVGKAKKEKLEREQEYQRRLAEDLRNSGIEESQISAILERAEKREIEPEKPTYTRMSRRYLSIETLHKYKIDYEFDQNPDYVLIKRWVPEYEQDFLWSQTLELRKQRQKPNASNPKSKQEQKKSTERPTYTRMSRRHLSIETLNKFEIDYEFDQDPDFVLIKRLVPEHEQDTLWTHTREVREQRQKLSERNLKAKHNKIHNAERPTYTRMSRRHLSLETLRKYKVDYELDKDPDYVLIKRWVPEYEQDFLWSHTREIRKRRESLPVGQSKDKTRRKGDGKSGFGVKTKNQTKPTSLSEFLRDNKKSDDLSTSLPDKGSSRADGAFPSTAKRELFGASLDSAQASIPEAVDKKGRGQAREGHYDIQNPTPGPSRPLRNISPSTPPYPPRQRPTLQEVLADKAPPPWTLSAFMTYLSQNHCLETLEFTMDANRYTRHYSDVITVKDLQPSSTDYVRKLWQKLLDAYVAPNGPREVNLPANVRDHLLSLPWSQMPPDPAELKPAVAIIYELMEQSILVPFLDSFGRK